MTPSVPAAAVPARLASVRSSSTEETRGLGSALAGVAEAGDRIALIGHLGAGKTQFAKGFARGLGISDVVNSPSFTLMSEYEGRLRLFHQDLYRLAGAGEAMAGGLLDERQESGVTLTEWADRLESGIDPDRLEIRLMVNSDDERTIELVTAHPERHARYLARAVAWAARRDTDAVT
jgi:tRNA threonylcarbamoyladenosine biosynthesis protein TsaE